MKEQIKNRYTGEVQFECDVPPELQGASGGIRKAYAFFMAVSKGANEFIESDLRGMDFSQSAISNVTFNSCNLTNANFKLATLDSVEFNNCVLCGATFKDSTVVNPQFARSVLTGADFENVDIGRRDVTSSHTQAVIDERVHKVSPDSFSR